MTSSNATVPRSISDPNNPNLSEDLKMWVLAQVDGPQERKQLLRAWTLGGAIERNHAAVLANIAGFEIAPMSRLDGEQGESK